MTAANEDVFSGNDITPGSASGISDQSKPMESGTGDALMPHDAESDSELDSVHHDELNEVTIQVRTLLGRMEDARTTQETILQRMESLSKSQESLMGVFVIQSVLLFIGCVLIIVTGLWILFRWPAWRKDILMR